jgi:hypothetical protein
LDSPRTNVAPAHESLAVLERRIASIFPTVRELLARPFPARASSCEAGAFVVTGVGGSEGPARLLVGALVRAGRPARFVPMSALIEGTFEPSSNEALCLFSQGLSPNACAALATAVMFRDAFLFTSTPPEAPVLEGFVRAGGNVVFLPPPEESGSLLRVVGPAIAMLGAALFSGADPPRNLAEALEKAAADATRIASTIPRDRLFSPLAFVTSGENEGLARGLAIKWIEGLARPSPPTWDALEVAHGPFHAFYTETLLLVAVGPPTPLFSRLEALLVPERHTLVRFETSMPFPYARLELEVAVNALFLKAFEAEPRDLFSWPSKGKDEALYGIASALSRSTSCAG